MKRWRYAVPALAVTAAAIAASVLALRSDSSDEVARGDTSPRSAPPIKVVGRDDSKAPRPCKARSVAETLRSFSTALTQRRAADAARPFAREPRFKWYSASANRKGEKRVRAERNSAVYDRAKLRSYLGSRIRHDESMRVSEVKVTYYASRNRADLELIGNRQADDLQVQTRRIAGKGAVDCRSGKVMLLSIGMLYTDRSPCPGKARPGSQTIIACSS